MAKIIFRLDDEDSFPPIRVEMINASPLSGGLFRIENAAFFVTDVAYNDVVRASPTDVAGHYDFEEVVEQSQFTAISIIILDEVVNSFLMDLFRGLDCVLEYGEFGVYRVLGVAIPRSVDYLALRATLEGLEGRDLISFAELALAPGC